MIMGPPSKVLALCPSHETNNVVTEILKSENKHVFMTCAFSDNSRHGAKLC
jgi:hypothetical protein